MRAWSRLRPDLLGQKKILKPRSHEVYISHGVFVPLSATQVEPVQVAEMPTPVSFPVPLIDENSRTMVEYDFDTIFNHPQVMMRDRDAVEKKLRIMVEGGKEKLMVISDFDYTLSRYEDSLGRRCWTTHGVFDNCSKQVDPELSLKLQRLKEKYFPVEFDPKLTLEQKVPYMEEWWNTSHNHIVSARFHRRTVENFVRNSKIILRDQADQMMTRLNQLGVPLVVFSAGIGNIIEMYLEQRLGQIPSNIHIISNMMNFDD
ncbi:Pyrimidine 5'-nucleotidase, partial [Cooperia oncophora]